jgi:hypothetical protein
MPADHEHLTGLLPSKPPPPGYSLHFIFYKHTKILLRCTKCKISNEGPDRSDDRVFPSVRKEVQLCSDVRNVIEKVLSLLFVAGIAVMYFPGKSFFQNFILMHRPVPGL